MHVAITLEKASRSDGQGRVAFEIAKFALGQGLRVTLVSRTIDSELRDLGANWLASVPRRWPVALLSLQDTARVATRVLRENANAFDVIHGFGFSLNLLHHVNSVQFVHSAWLESPCHTFRVRRNIYGAYHWLFSTMNVRWERRAFAQANVLVACSRSVREQLAGVGIPLQKITLIENAVAPEEFESNMIDRAIIGLPKNGVVALFVGDIRSPRKNLETVLQTLVRIPLLHLAVIGETRGSPYLKIAETLGLSSRVHFLGFRKDVSLIMKAVDIFVFPSRYEPFGLVVLEAMAAGLPVITCENVGAASLVTSDAGIVLRDTEDVEALTGAIKLLAEDQARRTQMGAHGRKIAQTCNWNRMGEQYLRLYEQCVRRNH